VILENFKCLGTVEGQESNEISDRPVLLLVGGILCSSRNLRLQSTKLGTSLDSLKSKRFADNAVRPQSLQDVAEINFILSVTSFSLTRG
jgi:hypothetical protein